MIGTSLGPYKIIEQLGAGGMGEVYLGEDTRLGRTVAIKVLPAEFAADAERLARFEQEARAAALNHPHIAMVHDVGAEAGDDGALIHFIVQEYLEGQTLGDALLKGPLSLNKALALAAEIGEALEAPRWRARQNRQRSPIRIPHARPPQLVRGVEGAGAHRAVTRQA
ncbi:MAG: protein kinase [Acidobacteria bacterium]|nr:protein kinase [Acidobacteriota bacterium]